MATTVNYSTRNDGNSDLNGQGAAWTSIIAGQRTTSSFIEVKSGIIEYAEAPTATAPATSMAGHVLSKDRNARGGESQNIETVAAATTIWARAISSDALVVVTPGTAA